MRTVSLPVVACSYHIVDHLDRWSSCWRQFTSTIILIARVNIWTGAIIKSSFDALIENKTTAGVIFIVISICWVGNNFASITHSITRSSLDSRTSANEFKSRVSN